MDNNKQLTEWPAEDYAIGSYIQSTVAEPYLPVLAIKPTDDVLDIGCGNGRFSAKILQRYPMQSFTGIDSSHNMLQLAQQELADFPSIELKQMDVLTMPFHEAFDFVMSFWCLQWTSDIKAAFTAIYEALKPQGRLFCLFPTGNDPFMLTYQIIKEKGLFPALDQFTPPINYPQLDNLEAKLKTIDFKTLKVEHCHQSLLLPSLDFFRKFVNGIAFFHGQVPLAQIPSINEALVEAYDALCQQQFNGQHIFEFSYYCIEGQKN